MGELSATNAKGWWDEWQLRVLALASLVVQYAMFFIAGKRSFSTPSWFRQIVRLLFVGGDALALYALTTLFSRQKSCPATHGQHGGSRDLEVLWAPILMMHFGGLAVPTISSIDNNDKWQRLIKTILLKVSVLRARCA